MKKPVVTSVCALFVIMQASANINLYGVTQQGGAFGYGTLFKYDASTNTETVVKSFNYSDGAYPKGKLVRANNNKFYGTANSGGANGNGVLFEFDPATNTYTQLASFEYSSTGAFPYGSCIQLSNGKIVGTSVSGGTNGSGTIWEFDITGNVLSTLYNFDDSVSGAYPYGAIMQASNGKLYGVTSYGGSSGYGTLYEFDEQTSALTVKRTFDYYNDGGYGMGRLTETSNGNLFGTNPNGGVGDYGTLFQYNINTSVFTKRLDFDYNVNGAYSNGSSLFLGSSGLLYGTNTAGGSFGYGCLYGFDPVSGTVTVLHNFDYVSDGISNNPVMQASDGNLYGMTYFGGSNAGSIYRYNGATNTYTTEINFNNLNGAYPYFSELTEAAVSDPCAGFAASASAGTIICAGGTTTVVVSASGGTVPYSGTGSFTAPAGTYSYTVTDAKGCTSVATVTLTEPAPLVASAGSDKMVYYGYDPKSCTTLSASASGGTAPYSFTWSTGQTTASITACPTAATVYTVTVRDAKGCVSNATVKICVINVKCSKGGNSIVYYDGGKVLVCHVPNGNYAGRYTICIAADAVPDHLAHGDKLGVCDEPTCFARMQNEETGDVITEGLMNLKAYPNPFADATTIRFSLPEDGKVSVRIYNLVGEQVAVLFDGSVLKDEAREVVFHSGDQAGGVYFCKLITASGEVKAEKILLTR